ncbi:MAG TPA: G1 family glutamic endopeptidase, partial [Candidatus Limnocylindrales bacterium]|nr:G1 family glutamic endopeptidase [Candidatus Limnocylindrales bacterium]
IVNYTSSRLSAEWIVEKPSLIYPPFELELTDFGNVTFTNCSASVGSVTGGIGSFPWEEFVMYSSATPRSSSSLLADVSDLNTEGTEFTVTYVAPEGTTS